MKVSSETVVYSMAAENKPVATCKPGNTIIFETKDCFSNQIRTEDKLFELTDWDTVNPATGPVAVEGAMPGDVLKVSIKKIEVAGQGVMIAVPEMGFLDKYIEESQTKIIPIENDQAVFNDKIKLPLSPMIGVIGTAPAEIAVPCGTPGSHGGNMDTTSIKEGADLYLPVFVEGGLLAMGDLHAVMGDGEVVVCGVEIAGEVTVKVDLIKGKSISDPILENSEAWYTIASAPTLGEAAQKVTDNMFEFLSQRLSLPTNEIGMLMSLICDLEVCQVVDPEKTARMKLDKKALAEYDLMF